MHGLRCSPAIPGFTRLLDEWVIGLTRYSGEAVFAEPERFQATLSEAIQRVRAFAFPAGEAPATLWHDEIARFELQGYEYVAARRLETIASADELVASAEAWMNDAAEVAAAAPHEPAGVASDGDEAPLAVGIVCVRVRGGVPLAVRDAVRELGSTGAAWSFPSASEGGSYAYAGDDVGGVLLAKLKP